MRKVSLTVRLLDNNHLWEDGGCCRQVFWPAVASVCRGRLGLTLTIMCAATLLSMGTLLFACYAVVSENTRHRGSKGDALTGIPYFNVRDSESVFQENPSYRRTNNDVQLRALIRDDQTGNSIYIKTPLDQQGDRFPTDVAKPRAANIFLLLHNNVSHLLNRTGSELATDQKLKIEKSFQKSNELTYKDVDLSSNLSHGEYAVLDPGSGATRSLPQAIIIGVKKGGTRALLEFIRLHPDVRAPGPETHFFDRNYHKGLDWYRSKMPPTISGQITVEKTPSYFVTKEVPARIYSMSKDVKLIVVVRDPVTRAISDYTQAHTKRPETKPFEQMAFLDNSTGIVDTSWGAIRIGVYAKHLSRWLKYFPLQQIHFVNGEKLITDPAQEIAKVQKFLGLKCIVTEKHFYFNESKGFPCLKKHEGSGKPHCLGKTKGRTHPHIDSRAVQKLRNFYHPFNVKFYELTGQNFDWPVN